MADNDVTIAAGQTWTQRIDLDMGGTTLTEDDRLLMVIRKSTLGAKSMWHHVYQPAQDGAGPYIIWEMSHKETQELEPGSYIWGLSLFRDAELEGDVPVDGTVGYPIECAKLNVTSPAADERCIDA